MKKYCKMFEETIIYIQESGAHNNQKFRSHIVGLNNSDLKIYS